MIRSRIPATLCTLAMLAGGTSMAGEPTATTHPLMPGIRSAEINNPDWPRVLHDGQITGFSPLVLGMREAPEVWREIAVGGEIGWLREVACADGATRLLVADGRLRLFDAGGAVRWETRGEGTLAFWGDLCGDGRDVALMVHGNRLALLDGENGETVWAEELGPPHAHLQVDVADAFPEKLGREVAVFPQYHDEGMVLSFPRRGAPEVLWRRQVTIPGEWDERADHGVGCRFDLSVPGAPLVWNVRHHRCRGFDARTGATVSELVYNLGGGWRRNYGPWSIATARDGSLAIVTASEFVQTHVHGIRLNRSGPSALAWERYYGEVYVFPGVVVRRLLVGDPDGDGGDEIVYNARDPENDFRSFVRSREVGTGAVEVELADSWCSGVAENAGPEGRPVFLVHPAPGGRMPEQGRLALYTFDSAGDSGDARTNLRREFPAARRWGVTTVPSANGPLVLLRDDAPGDPALVLVDGRTFRTVARSAAAALLSSPIRAVIPARSGRPEDATYIIAGRGGTLEGRSWDGSLRWETPLEGGAVATMSAADIDGDGRAELVVAAPGDRVRVFDLGDDGVFSEKFSAEFFGLRSRSGPILYDLEENGGKCVVAPGTTPDGHLAVRAYRGDGTLLWETPLDAPTDDNCRATSWNCGRFITDADGSVHPGIALCVFSTGRMTEGMYLIDGRTGAVRWFRDFYREGVNIRGWQAVGIPGAFDFDGDGADEINMDLYSYMAMVRGDGSFAFLRGTINVRPEAEALWAANLYNSYMPVWKSPNDDRPHWFAPLGHDRFGLMNPEPTTGIWREIVGYDNPDRAGLVDVDGDGRMEVGYALRNDTTFRCRDLFTGETKWTVTLPKFVAGPVMAADVDGDGKGEFLVGRYCIGTDADGKGEIRWESPVPFGWAIVADFDGDGRGEIACATHGKVVVLTGRD